MLCNPFGEEAARAHRLFRVLAGQLERAGYAVLRFDYRGTGDSAGEFGIPGEGSVLDWVEDIGLAAAELRKRAGATRVVLVGLRFGATLAALAALRSLVHTQHLILCDPVVNGDEYLPEMLLAHQKFMAEELGVPQWSGGSTTGSAKKNVEALGVGISPEFAAELTGINLARQMPRVERTTVVCSSATPAMLRLRESTTASAGNRWIDLVDVSAWNSDASLNSMIVPMEIVRTLASVIEEYDP